jgi:hypothetical protein
LLAASFKLQAPSAKQFALPVRFHLASKSRGLLLPLLAAYGLQLKAEKSSF